FFIRQRLRFTDLYTEILTNFLHCPFQMTPL
ncbi:hypothetical protein HMPREF1028_00537, partial [Neisseria sp. GT4A_CT1]